MDITEIERIREVIERHGERFLQRVFTPLEIEYCQRHRNRFERFAARFAAKEAAMKALGTGWRRGVTWRDFEVSNGPSGRPSLTLSGKALEIYRGLGARQIVVSLSHGENYALAEVIIEGNTPAGRE